MPLDVVDGRSGWREKFRNAISKANLHRLFSGKREVVVVEVRPSRVLHFDVRPEDGLSSLVVDVETLCSGFQSTGRCRLRRVKGSVNHERCVCASLAMLRAEVCDSRNRGDVSDVVQRQANR